LVIFAKIKELMGGIGGRVKAFNYLIYSEKKVNFLKERKREPKLEQG